MNVRKLPIIGLLVMAAIVVTTVPAMAHSGEEEEIEIEITSLDEVSVCIFIEENWESYQPPTEQFECSELMIFDSLPLEAQMELMIEISRIESEDAYAEFWQFYEPPTARKVATRHHQQTGAKTPAYSGGVEQWRGLVAKYFADADVNKALAVINCESKGGDPNAVNPTSNASGLFQHIPKYWSERSALAGWAGADIFSPEANIAVAAWLVYNEGWHHWPNCSRLG